MVLTDPLSLTFAALADPTRRAILSRLAGADATVNELAEPFAISLQAVSHHIQVLERAGLVAKAKVAQTRSCRLEAAPLQPAIDWIEQQRELWAHRFDQLEHHLLTVQRAHDARKKNDQ